MDNWNAIVVHLVPKYGVYAARPQQKNTCYGCTYCFAKCYPGPIIRLLRTSQNVLSYSLSKKKKSKTRPLDTGYPSLHMN